MQNRFLVVKLTADVADLRSIIVQKDSTITRLNESVKLLTLAKPETSQPARNAAQAGPMIRPPTGVKRPVINWPKVENWGWRGLFCFLAVQAIRSAIN